MQGKTIVSLLGCIFSFTVGCTLIDSYPMTAFALAWCAGGLGVHVHRDLKEND